MVVGYRGFHGHGFSGKPRGHHDCPGPVFEWHRFARETWDWWWFPFDVDQGDTTTAVPRRAYRRPEAETPILEHYYDEDENARLGRVTVFQLPPNPSLFPAVGSSPSTFVLDARAPIYAMANGELVAARLPPPGAGASLAFVLVRHEVFHVPDLSGPFATLMGFSAAAPGRLWSTGAVVPLLAVYAPRAARGHGSDTDVGAQSGLGQPRTAPDDRMRQRSRTARKSGNKRDVAGGHRPLVATARFGDTADAARELANRPARVGRIPDNAARRQAGARPAAFPAVDADPDHPRRFSRRSRRDRQEHPVDDSRHPGRNLQSLTRSADIFVAVERQRMERAGGIRTIASGVVSQRVGARLDGRGPYGAGEHRRRPRPRLVVEDRRGGNHLRHRAARRRPPDPRGMGVSLQAVGRAALDQRRHLGERVAQYRVQDEHGVDQPRPARPPSRKI